MSSYLLLKLKKKKTLTFTEKTNVEMRHYVLHLNKTRENNKYRKHCGLQYLRHIVIHFKFFYDLTLLLFIVYRVYSI